MMLSINAEAGIIPSSSGIEMPSAEFAIGKRPISDTTVNDVRIQVYTPFSESDCNAFSQYLANWGCLLGKSDTVNGIFTAEIEYNAYKIVFSYEKTTQKARIEYPLGTKPEDSKSYAKVQKNGILPNNCTKEYGRSARYDSSQFCIAEWCQNAFTYSHNKSISKCHGV